MKQPYIPVYTFVPAPLGFSIIDFYPGVTEKEVLHNAEPVIAWAICQEGIATPVTAYEGVRDLSVFGDSVLMYSNGRVDTGDRRYESFRDWMAARVEWHEKERAENDAKDAQAAKHSSGEDLL